MSNYWLNEGKFQEQYNKLFLEFIPSDERPRTFLGKVLQAMIGRYFERFENGDAKLDDLKDYQRIWDGALLLTNYPFNPVDKVMALQFFDFDMTDDKLDKVLDFAYGWFLWMKEYGL